MASKKHLEVLSQGVEAWNNWRTEDPDATPDLSGPVELQISPARWNFSRTKMSGATLTHNNLCGVNFWEADLRGADLRAA